MFTVDGTIGLVEVFRADSKWYAKKCYELFGENVSPFKDGEIELISDERGENGVKKFVKEVAK